jgi:hypothetical protein
MLQYHARTLDLIGVMPSISPARLEAIEQAQGRLGHRLPESVREWYSLDNAVSLLEHHSNCDTTIDVGKFASPATNGVDEQLNSLLDDGFLVFRIENQGVCLWAVDLRDGDDPPVLVEIDGDGWHRCTDTFSLYVYLSVWDHSQVLQSPELLIQAQHSVLTEEALPFLRREFHPGPISYGWPGHTQYRFERHDQRLLVWASDDQTDWFLAASTEASLKSLLLSVWNCESLNRSLWSNTDAGERILREIRASRQTEG